jgi:SPX domain protein involved in polyphosphate accumulation
LLDIGLSSDQLADEDRGFSYQSSGTLDLRFDRSRGEAAWQLLARLDERSLADLIYQYGEERRSRRIARAIVEARKTGRIERTLAEEILLLLKIQKIKPAMQMRYDRLAFEGPDDVRITFDSGIKARSQRRPLQPDDQEITDVVLPQGQCIMEVKIFGAAPYWVRELAARHRLVKTPFSKYCNALEKHDPMISGLLEASARKASPSVQKNAVAV